MESGPHLRLYPIPHTPMAVKAKPKTEEGTDFNSLQGSPFPFILIAGTVSSSLSAVDVLVNRKGGRGFKEGVHEYPLEVSTRFLLPWCGN